MIGNNAEGDIDLFLLWIDCRVAAPAALFARQAMRLPYNWQRSGVPLSAQFFQLVENGPKDVCLVIGNYTRKIGKVFCALNNRGDALEAHSSINVTRSERDILGAAGVAHHPKIVGLATTKNMNLWIEISFAEQMRPVIVRFLIKLTRLARTGFVHRRVKPLGGKFPAVDQ